MAIIALKVPNNISKLLGNIDVPGETVPSEEKHITILNLGDGLPIETIGKIVVLLARETEKICPFHVQVQGISTFPKRNEMIPVICPAFSEELHDLNKRLSTIFDIEGIEYSKRFPEFKPHVTLSYSEQQVKDTKFKTPINWLATDLVLWCGDHSDDRLYTVFDFLG